MHRSLVQGFTKWGECQGTSAYIVGAGLSHSPCSWPTWIVSVVIPSLYEARRRIELYSPNLAHYAHFELERSIRIPTEIVDHIIAHAFILSSCSHSFASIAAVSLASSRFRQISLRLFFSTIKARSRTRWFKLWDILASMNRNGVRGVSPYVWVRYV